MRESYKNPEDLNWRDVQLIYKTRFAALWRAFKLNVMAALVLLGGLVLIPFFLGIALFSGHFAITVILVGVVVLASGWLYWEGLKLAFGKEN